MAKTNQSALARHRRRLKARGVARLEVRVGRTDVELVRSVVDALTDPRRDVEARALLRRHFAPPPAGSLKALLASAPLEGVDLTRDRDLPRQIDAWPT